MPKWLPAITLALPTALPPSTGERTPRSRRFDHFLLFDLFLCGSAVSLARCGAGMHKLKWFLLLSLLKLGEGAVIPPLPQLDFRRKIALR